MTDSATPARDGTDWEEARGPHLPDRLTSVPWPAWPFVVLAVIQAVAIWQTQGADIVRDIGRVGIQALLYAIPKIAYCLLGAALFIRHRDAVRTVPMVVAGVALFAAQQVLGILEGPLRSLVGSSTDVFADEATVMVTSSAYTLFSSVVGVFGLLYLARGLAAARRFEGGADRRIGIGLLMAVLVTIGLIAVGYSQVPLDDVVGGPVLIVGSLLVTAAVLLATAYLTMIAQAGRRAGEDPSTGWALAASYGLVTIAASLVGALVAAFWAAGDNGIGLAMGYAFALVSAATALMLLGAFALGLPSSDPNDPDDPDPDALPV